MLSRQLLRRLLVPLLGLLAVMGIVLVGRYWFFPSSTPSALTERNAPVWEVQAQPFEYSLDLAATVQPESIVEVSAQSSGQIKTLLVKPGDVVEKDQLLAEIDPVLAEADLMAARAAVASAQAQQKIAELQLVETETQLTNDTALFEKKLLSQRDLRRSQLAVATQRLTLAGLQAQTAQSKGQLEKVTLSVQRTQVRAPIAGTVLSLNTAPGQVVVLSQQAPVLLKLANLNKMQGKLVIPDADFGRVKLGQSLNFDIADTSGPERWESKITARLPIPEKTQGVNTYVAYFPMDNANGQFWVDQAVRVRLHLEKIPQALLVPISYIGKGPTGGFQVLRQTAKGTEIVPVTLGVNNSEHAVVTSGLTAGDRLLPLLGNTSAMPSVPLQPTLDNR